MSGGSSRPAVPAQPHPAAVPEERVELFAIPGNERMLVLAHGPQRSLLLLRAADAATVFGSSSSAAASAW